MAVRGRSVKVKGIRELDRDLGRIDKDLRRDLRREMSAGAKIVSDDAREWTSGKYGGRVSTKIRPRTRGASAYVESRAASRGIRPDFGVLIQRVLLISRAKKQDEVLRHVDAAIDKLADGFNR